MKNLFLLIAITLIGNVAFAQSASVQTEPKVEKACANKTSACCKKDMKAETKLGNDVNVVSAPTKTCTGSSAASAATSKTCNGAVTKSTKACCAKPSNDNKVSNTKETSIKVENKVASKEVN